MSGIDMFCVSCFADSSKPLPSCWPFASCLMIYVARSCCPLSAESFFLPQAECFAILDEGLFVAGEKVDCFDGSPVVRIMCCLTGCCCGCLLLPVDAIDTM